MHSLVVGLGASGARRVAPFSRHGTQTSVFVPREFLEPETAHELEVMTITESATFTTDAAL